MQKPLFPNTERTLDKTSLQTSKSILI